MKALAIVLTVIAAVFSVVSVLELRTALHAAQNSVFFHANTYLLVIGLAPMWVPTIALDVACFAIWRLISKPKSGTLSAVA